MLNYAKPPSVDSDCYISASAYEVINYLYYAWNIYKEHEMEVRVEPVYGQYISKMDRPCDSCFRYKRCSIGGFECNQYKQWVDSGKYDPKKETIPWTGYEY